MSSHQQSQDIFKIQGLDTINIWQQHYAGQKTLWFGEDDQENFQKNCSDPNRAAQLRAYGWMDHKIYYEFNSHGFRGPEPLCSQDHFCVFGDSVTFGSAIRQQDLYHESLARQWSLSGYNFGVSGGSDDTAVRLAMTWLPKLRAKFVIWQRTFDHRYEIIGTDKYATVYGVQAAGGGDTPNASDLYHQMWIAHDENRRLAAVKNFCTMRELCHSYGVPLFVIDIEDFFQQYGDRGRDLLHPGPRCHATVADQVRSRIMSANVL